MKKTIVFIFSMLASFSAVHANDDLQDLKTSAYVVIEANGDVSRYVADRGDYYLVEVQDTVQVPKEGSRLDIYKAENGQGIIVINGDVAKRVRVRQQPTTKSRAICSISYPDGMVPDVYPCKGLVKGADGYRWYKTLVNGKTGYIREDLMEWDCIDSY